MKKTLLSLLLALSLLAGCAAEAAGGPPGDGDPAAGRDASSQDGGTGGPAGEGARSDRQGGQEAVKTAAITVSTALPQVEDFSLTTDYIGTVTASESISVYPSVSGTVASVHYEPGQTVRAGALLFSIDASDAALTIEKAELTYQKALNTYENAVNGSAVASKELQLQNTITQALRNFNNARENAKLETDFDVTSYNKLRRAYKAAYKAWEEGTGSIDELYEAEKELSYLTDELSDHNSLLTQLDNSFDTLEAARSELALYQEQTKGETAATAELNLKEAELAYQQTLKSLDDYQTYAPISGVIESRGISAHGSASPNTAAYVISNRDVLSVVFNVSADGAAALSLGDEVTLTKGQSSYSAAIVEIETKANASGLFPIKANIEGDSPLLPGVAVKVTARTRSAADAMVVSIDDISYEDSNPYVYVYQNGTAVRTFLELGITTREKAQVLSGLTADSQVITTWHPDLADGAQVALKNGGAAR